MARKSHAYLRPRSTCAPPAAQASGLQAAIRCHGCLLLCHIKGRDDAWAARARHRSQAFAGVGLQKPSRRRQLELFGLFLILTIHTHWDLALFRPIATHLSNSTTMAIPTPSPAPKSHHLSDPATHPFLTPSFDPATYLNSTLPSLSLSARPPPNNASLPDLSAQTQTLLAQLSAQTARLSASLTQLTDEIIRSGGRLAYEVEVLRGETTGLTDALENGLKKDIELLAPAKQEKKSTQAQPDADAAPAEAKEDYTAALPPSREPAHLASLRELSTLRARLETVVQTFGAATAWPAAPSEIASTASSFISVSGPEATESNRQLEQKAQEYAASVRSEISELLAAGDVEGAGARVGELRVLAEVWRGTAEEKARGRFVEGLGRLVEEKERAASAAAGKGGEGRKAGQPARGVDMRYGDLDSRAEGGYGFLQNLRNLKDGMYLD